MKDNKYLYQAAVILNPKIEEKDRDLAVNKIVGWLESEGAKVVKKDHVGLKDLVYEIKGHKKGDFWVFDIESIKPVKLKDLNLSLNREANIIRYLILKS